MSEDEELQWLIEKMKNPTIFEKINKTIKQSLKDKSEIKVMRSQLIQEFKAPFIERVKATSSDPWSEQITIKCFDHRIKTLPDSFILNLYDDFLKSKTMKTEKGKDTVQNWILTTLELSYSLDGWFMKKMVNHIKKR
jgi:hypothetical protein